MSRQIFINLPVTDLDKSKAFYEALGFNINKDFTDDKAACVVMGDGLHAMLHTHESLRRFTDKQICDPRTTVQALIAIQVESRTEVDRLAAAAVANGGSTPRPSQDHGFCYYHAFEDLDGNTWEPMWLNPEVSA
ncbi:MAG: VOC family protein [Verrucomicrobiaceae bacterium]|nr:VOC family protein [Verrucomicrobiaceae bacterium]